VKAREPGGDWMYFTADGQVTPSREDAKRLTHAEAVEVQRRMLAMHPQGHEVEARIVDLHQEAPAPAPTPPPAPESYADEGRTPWGVVIAVIVLGLLVLVLGLAGAHADPLSDALAKLRADQNQPAAPAPAAPTAHPVGDGPAKTLPDWAGRSSGQP
jgi:hypothetical protein